MELFMINICFSSEAYSEVDTQCSHNISKVFGKEQHECLSWY